MQLTKFVVLIPVLVLLYIAPANADTLNVLVLNETNLIALSNVNVTAFNATWVDSEITNSSGWVVFTVGADTYTINGTLGGYGSNESSVIVSGVTNFNLTLMIWHLDGYTIRKSFDIEGFTSNQTDYPVNLSLNYGTGADGSGSLYFNSTIQSDFDDIRITNWTGAILDHWLTDIVASVSAEMWFKADLIVEDIDTSFWAYYNNTLATDASNGTATFTFFDDFELNLDQWSDDGDGTIALSAAQAREGTNSMKLDDTNGASDFVVWSDTFSALPTLVYHGSMYPDTNNEYISFLPSDVVIGGGNEQLFFVSGNNGQWRYYDGAWNDLGAYAASAWYDIELYVNTSTDTFDTYVDNELLGSGLDFRNVGGAVDRFYHTTGSAETVTRYLDRMFIRKWAGDLVYGSVGPVSIFDDTPPPVEEEEDIIDWSQWTQQTLIRLIVYCGLLVMGVATMYHFIIGRIAS